MLKINLNLISMKHILILLILLSTVFFTSSFAQSTLDIYTDNTALVPVADGGWSSAASPMDGTEETTGGPYEGTKHLFYQYNNAGSEWGVQETLVINSWNAVDFTAYDSVVIAHKGEAEVISMEFRDANNASNSISLPINNTSVYELDTFALSAFFNASSVDPTSIVYIKFYISGATSGSFYIDNIVLVQNATTGIFKSKDQITGSVYPNPSTGDFTIDSDKSLFGCNIIVTSLVGEVVYQGEYSDKLSLSNLQKGMYVLKVENEKQFFVKQIIIH
jgi:hypothetical protein